MSETPNQAVKSTNPFGLATVTPYLVLKDVLATIDFVKEIFGAEVRGEPNMREDGSVMHAEVSIGTSVIMMGEKTDDVDWMPGMLYVYVEDCDDVYQRALERGAESVLPPQIHSCCVFPAVSFSPILYRMRKRRPCSWHRVSSGLWNCRFHRLRMET